MDFLWPATLVLTIERQIIDSMINHSHDLFVSLITKAAVTTLERHFVEIFFKPTDIGHEQRIAQQKGPQLEEHLQQLQKNLDSLRVK